MSTVVILEDDFWQPGVDFGAALRRRGHRVVRCTSTSANDRLQERWATCSDVVLPAAIGPDGALDDRALAALESPDLLDWQAAEPCEMWLCQSGLEQRLLPYTRSAPLAPDEIIDKSRLCSYLDDCGIAVPAFWDRLQDVPDGESGPFILKPRSGAGGVGIQVLEDLAAARRDDYGDVQVQRFHPGPALDSAGVAREGEVVQLLTYRNTVNPRAPFSAAYGITSTDDPQLANVTRRVVAALGLTGPFALDAVADVDGQPLVIDVNVRIYGSWTACQALGLDVIGAYEYAMGLGPRPPAVIVPAGRQAEILRRPPLNVATRVQRLRWLASQSAEVGRRRRWLGTDWARATMRDCLGWAMRGKSL